MRAVDRDKLLKDAQAHADDGMLFAGVFGFLILGAFGFVAGGLIGVAFIALVERSGSPLTIQATRIIGLSSMLFFALVGGIWGWRWGRRDARREAAALKLAALHHSQPQNFVYQHNQFLAIVQREKRR